MINRFSQYLIEEQKTVYFTFGRMNPPTTGHGKLLDKLASAAGRNPYKVFLSHSVDPAKNPLSYSDKIKHVRKMFPKHARNIVVSNKARTAIEVLVELYSQGFNHVVMVVGADRIREFDVLMNKYNGKEARHGFYNFASIKVISAGDRDPDAEGVEGMSASKMRKFANDNDFVSFAQGAPSSMSTKDTRKLYNDVRKGMGLKEEKNFKNHLQLIPVSEAREQYIAGKLYELGEQVVIKKTHEVGTIAVLGSNYVIVEVAGGRKLRQWLDAVESLDENKKTDQWYKDQPEWGTDEAAKAAKKKTPGQTNEQSMDMVRDRISRDKQAEKKREQKRDQQMDRKHDIMLDRARRAIMLRKNRGIKPE